MSSQTDGKKKCKEFKKKELPQIKLERTNEVQKYKTINDSQRNDKQLKKLRKKLHHKKLVS